MLIENETTAARTSTLARRPVPASAPPAKIFIRRSPAAARTGPPGSNLGAAAPPAAQTEDDAALVARCRRGDGAAWTSLVQRYQRLVYAIARRVGLDEHGAADVFQVVFSRLVEHLSRIAEPQRLQAWIVTTTKREALRQRKLGQRCVSMTRSDDDADADAGSQRDFADPSPTAEQALDDLQQLNQLRNALDRLDARCRDLLLLLFRDDDDKLAYDEVARRMGSTVGSIGPTRSRCLAKLRSFVG